MSEHTPGPWMVDKDRNFLVNTAVDDRRVAYLAPRDQEANARLIAAAPELLEALVYARRFLRPADHDTDYVDSVIAKARGTS